MSPTRRARGAATERHAANHLANNGWPYASVTRGIGTDITGTPGLLWEIKARRGFSPIAWLRQARRHGTGIPIAIIRPDGYGPEHVGDWAGMLRLDDLIQLLHEAGYGTPSTTQPTGSKLQPTPATEADQP